MTSNSWIQRCVLLESRPRTKIILSPALRNLITKESTTSNHSGQFETCLFPHTNMTHGMFRNNRALFLLFFFHGYFRCGFYNWEIHDFYFLFFVVWCRWREREEGESTQIHGYNHKSDSSPLECPHFLWIVHIKLLLQTWHLNYS